MPEEKEETKKLYVPLSLKREIAIIAGSEQRPEYEIVADAMNLYKQVALGKSPKKNKKPVPVADVIATH